MLRRGKGNDRGAMGNNEEMRYYLVSNDVINRPPMFCN